MEYCLVSWIIIICWPFINALYIYLCSCSPCPLMCQNPVVFWTTAAVIKFICLIHITFYYWNCLNKNLSKYLNLWKNYLKILLAQGIKSIYNYDSWIVTLQWGRHRNQILVSQMLAKDVSLEVICIGSWCICQHGPAPWAGIYYLTSQVHRITALTTALSNMSISFC